MSSISDFRSNDCIRISIIASEIFDRIRIIYLLREFFRIFIKFLANWSFFFTHSINSISRLEIFEFFHNIFSNNQHWNHFFYLKVDHKTYLLIIANRHFFFVTKINSIFFYQNRQKFSSEILHQHSILNLFIVFENSTKLHSII